MLQASGNVLVQELFLSEFSVTGQLVIARRTEDKPKPRRATEQPKVSFVGEFRR
jgi:hypothetical protein